jgi:hypothetical protein
VLLLAVAAVVVHLLKKAKIVFFKIRRNENKWVRIRIENCRKLITGRLLHLTHGVSSVNNTVVTFVNVLPVNQCKGPIQINVNTIKNN